MMTKNKLQKVLIIGLLCSNLILIIFLVLGAPRHPRPPKEAIRQRLALDQEQMASYETLIAEHQKQIRAKQKEMMDLKTALYTTLNRPTEQHTIDSLSMAIGRIQTDIERVHYQHFGDIKKLLKDNQLASFKALTDDLAKMFSKPMKPK